VFFGRERLNSNDMLLGVVGPRSRASVDLIDLSARHHKYGILNGADCVADGTASAIRLHNLRECVITVKLDCLVARVGACEVAATALKALALVDHWGEELTSVHLLKRGDVLQLGADQVEDTLGGDLCLSIKLSLEGLEVVGRELASPALLVKLLLGKAVHVGLQTGLEVVVDCGGVEVLHSRANLKGLRSILNIAHGVITGDDTATAEDFNFGDDLSDILALS
jgi:hypothetical protein